MPGNITGAASGSETTSRSDDPVERKRLSGERSLRILVVVSHPHDFTHCGGTCGLHAADGDEVTVVSLMDGSYTHNERLHDELRKAEGERDETVMAQTREEYAEIKAAEFREVCDLFGVEDARILEYPEPFRLTDHPDASEAIRDIILEVRPHVLITQSPYLGETWLARNNSSGMASAELDDHTETARAVLEGRTLAGQASYDHEYAPHHVAATFYPGIYFMPDENDFYVDISAFADKRREAEAVFESQGHDEHYARRRVEIQAGQFGWIAGTEYAEGFVRERAAVVSRLPVSGVELAQAAEPHLDKIARFGRDDTP